MLTRETLSVTNFSKYEVVKAEEISVIFKVGKYLQSKCSFILKATQILKDMGK